LIGMNTAAIDWDRVKATFQNNWGYSDFRPPQGEVIRSLLEQRDALIVMPTGGGKSICFQLPALLQSGVTLVVSPLVALMENQVQELRQRQLPAALLHSQLPSHIRRQALWALQNQKLRLLYLSPETLLSVTVWDCLCQPSLKINGLILDEAHCLVQWGETFRSAYRRLGAVRPALLQYKSAGTQIAIAAFTATADPPTQAIIRETLGLQHPVEFKLSPYRANLHLNVQVAWTLRDRRQKLLRFIQTKHGQTGLVYARTRRDTEELAGWFAQQGFKTAVYHGGLSPEVRRTIENAWLSGALPFVVSTSAFGMGINKSDVGWVVHFHPPLLLTEYIQEIGRAGRDGRVAEALLLKSEPTGWLDPTDQQRRQFFGQQLQKQQQNALSLVKKIPPQGEIKTLSRQFPNSENALAILHSLGQLQWSDPFHYKILSTRLRSQAQHQSFQAAMRQMPQYLMTQKCRWSFLLHAFGFIDEARGLGCGHCDNCRK
jgi:ATP-dependent DNA helicase RecQ